MSWENGSIVDVTTAVITSFGAVFLAEMGDKSQIVCMALATRYRHWPVLAGATAAFLILNTLAVAFGAAIAAWVPQEIIALSVAGLFLVFGILFLKDDRATDEDGIQTKGSHGIFVTTFLMIFLAEMGDKTQIAVAAMAGTMIPVAVWIGASLALIATSALGVVVGRRLLRQIPLVYLRRAGGVLFLLLATFVVFRIT
jgi:putative Ca2+/H+ antiporter (TMEM165/GDT1 family)